MGDAIGSAMHGLGQFGSTVAHGVGNAATSAWHGLENLGGEALHGIEGAGSNILHSLLGGSSGGIPSIGESGTQPSSGSAAATPHMMFQGATALPGGGSLTDALPNMDISKSLMEMLGMGGGDPGFGGAGGSTAQTPEILPGWQSHTMPQFGDGAGGGAASGGNWISKYLIPGSVLAMSLARSQHTPSEIKSLRGIATEDNTRGHALEAGAEAALNGHLPGSAMASIAGALAAAQATIRQQYSRLGISGSTMEAQDLANAELQSQALAFQTGQQIAQQGFSAASGLTGEAARLYDYILQSETARGTSFGDALANFAAGLVDNGHPQPGLTG